MKLTAYLREQGYDLIEGPVRNHKPLQLWLKKAFNEAELYYLHINHAFKSMVVLSETEDRALSVNTSKRDDYNFFIGISLLEEILKSIGVGAFEISAKIKSGKNVSISYDNSYTRVIPTGELTNYFTKADFTHPNPVLLKNANRNNILVISGTVFARNLVVEIETDFNLESNFIADLNKAANGKLGFSIIAQQKLKMVSSNENFFPIAVKANKIDFDKGLFNGLKLVTDSRNFF